MKILVFYSGGKDSQASLIWAVNKYGANRCEAVFCDTGWENPVTYEHIRTTTEQLGVKLVTLKNAKYDGMVDLATKKGRFPSTKARFCTEELKSKPAIDYVLSHSEHLIIVEGIRKNESLSRSKMQSECTYFRYYFEPIRMDKENKPVYHTYRKREVKDWCKSWNADKVRPVFDWTAEQVIEYIKEAGQLPNPLYYMGFKRVGCFPCIMEGLRGIRLIIENHPDQWQRVKDAEDELCSNFFPPEHIPTRFCLNNKYPMATDIEKYITEKNATLDMFDEGGQPGCMSVYNLCE